LFLGLSLPFPREIKAASRRYVDGLAASLDSRFTAGPSLLCRKGQNSPFPGDLEGSRNSNGDPSDATLSAAEQPEVWDAEGKAIELPQAQFQTYDA
jgi:hypothetical protein